MCAVYVDLRFVFVNLKEERQRLTNTFPESYTFVIVSGSVIPQLCTSICSRTD